MNSGAGSLSYSRFMHELEQGRIASAYFFHGPEDVLMARALERLKAAALAPGTADFNFDLFRADADEMNWTAFSDSLTSLPLMSARRLVVLKQVGKAQQNKAVAGLIDRVVRRPQADLTLVLIEPEPDLRKSFFKGLLNHCVDVAFPYAKPAELQGYLIDFAAGFGKTLSDEALERILADSAPGIRDSLSKLEVLIFYVGDRKIIEGADVEASTVFSREVEIFHLLDALGRRDAGATRSTLGLWLQSRAEIGGLIHLLYRQIWALLRMKYLQERKIPGSQWQAQLDLKPPFLEKRYRGYLPNFSRQELGQSLEILAQMDWIRKSSAAGDDQLCWLLIEKLLNPVAAKANLRH